MKKSRGVFLIYNKGADMGSLSLFLKTDDRLGLLWKFSEEGGDIWNGAESVTIPKYSNYENFTFIFEGMLLTF